MAAKKLSVEQTDRIVHLDTCSFLKQQGVSREWFIQIVLHNNLSIDELHNLGYLEWKIKAHLEVEGIFNVDEIQYEDELPELTEEEYSAWFRTSRVDIVRVGRTFICVGSKLINLKERE